MAFLSNAKALYLDDEAENLANVETKFRDHGWYIETTLNIEAAKTKATGMDIFLCDQRLPEIGTTLTGTEVLKDIRRINKSVFLALYTAYHENLPEADVEWLLENNIPIYEKTDDDIFLLRLENDYANYRTLKDKESEIFLTLKKYVINHLKGISNQEFQITIPGAKKKLRVRDLIDEVNKTTPMGITYIEEWLDTKNIIEMIRQKNYYGIDK